MTPCRSYLLQLPYFRATGITAYLENGGTIEKAKAIAAHESPRTTKLYDRTEDACNFPNYVGSYPLYVES